MKNLLTKSIAFAVVMLSCLNCSVESIQDELLQEATVFEESQLLDNLNPCTAQDPQTRITNNGTITVALEIAAIGGPILFTTGDIVPGSSSAYLSFEANDIIFNVNKNTEGIPDEKIIFTMGDCMSLDLELGTDNFLIGNIPIDL